jgi:hypothetical protein
LIIAKGVARIHWQNLVNFGVLPLIFIDATDYDRLGQGDVIQVEGIHAAIKSGPTITIKKPHKEPYIRCASWPVGPANRCLHGWRIDKLEKRSAMTIPIWREYPPTRWCRSNKARLPNAASLGSLASSKNRGEFCAGRRRA